MPRTTRLHSSHPLFLFSICAVAIIALISFTMSGCSDSNLPNYVSGDDTGRASGIIYHGDIHVDGVEGFVSFVDVVTGNAEIASVGAISTSTSVYSINLPQGTYEVMINEGAIAFSASLPEYTSGTVTLNTPNGTVGIFGGFDTSVPVIGVVWNP